MPPCEKHLGNDIGSRSCALVDTKGRDICHGDPVAFHAVAMRYKTQRPVQFKIALAARPRTRCARPEAFAVARTSGRAVQTRYGGSSQSRFDVQWQPPRRWFALNRDLRRPSPTGADKTIRQWNGCASRMLPRGFGKLMSGAPVSSTGTQDSGPSCPAPAAVPGQRRRSRLEFHRFQRRADTAFCPEAGEISASHGP